MNKAMEDVPQEMIDRGNHLAQRISCEILSGESVEIALNTLVCLLANAVLTMPIEQRPEVLAHIIDLLAATVKRDTPGGMVQ
jgi:hypothetical protein